MTLSATLDHAFHEIVAMVDGLDDETWRRQYHPDLSPLGWHVGHTLFIETHWLRAEVLGDDTATIPLRELYLPWLNHKAERGRKLPPRNELCHFARTLHAENMVRLADLLAQPQQHPLLKDSYLLHFLIQHYGQHKETMQQVMQQRALHSPLADFSPTTTLQAQPPAWPDRVFVAGMASLGSRDTARAYDNELPHHHRQLDPFRLAGQPVTNAQYLGFMQASGYQRYEWWSADGQAWLDSIEVHAPEHWRTNRNGDWLAITTTGPASLAPDEAVYGINYYEASAFARYAGGRLPHEDEWEHAMAHDPELFAGSGQAWEWCANPFYPYAGFRPFPYDNYSLPWFDGRHYTLRGGSLFTAPAVRRVSFRNFYEPAKRHIFAGLRLAADDR